MKNSKRIPSNELGQFGEHLAHQFLLKRNYHVITTNHRTPLGEIDIIARAPDNTIHIIEVKTRRHNTQIPTTTNISTQKHRKLLTLATTYLASHPSPHPTVISAIFITIHLNTASIHFIPHI